MLLQRGSGGFRLKLGCVAALALFARQRDRGTHTLGDEIHQALHDALVRVDPGAGQNLAPVARTCPACDLFGAVAILLVVGNGIIQGGQNDGSKKLAGALTLLVVECGAVDEVCHGLSCYCSCVSWGSVNMTI